MTRQRISGILNVDKPAGMTSHDVVDRVRQLSGQRRVGHAGTLDPSATGVLVVCLGQATRVAEYLMASGKVYQAQIRLGMSTDTHDAEGQVTATAEVDVGEEEVRRALACFVGSIQQIPPMYSALKRGGVPLYKLARRGITLDKAVSLDELAQGNWREFIHPLDEALLDFEPIVVDAQAETRIRHGQQVEAPPLPSPIAGKEKREEFRRAYSEEGRLIAILRHDPQTGLWQPKKVFTAS